jgi:hypothetical protein
MPNHSPRSLRHSNNLIFGVLIDCIDDKASFRIDECLEFQFQLSFGHDELDSFRTIFRGAESGENLDHLALMEF